MKRAALGFVVLVAAATSGLALAGPSTPADGAVPADDKVAKDCTFRGKKLHGKVKVVQHFPDFKVKVVQHFPDLKVQMVQHFPDTCGKWQIVENFPDFTVQYVEHFPDFQIQKVDHFPGLP
jgi:hypothetical protein